MGRSRISAHILLFTAIVAMAAAACGQDAPVGAQPAGTVPVVMGPGPLEGTVDPDSYVLGAGDGLAIGFWGEVNRQETVYVNPDGDILIIPVGPVRVGGMTLGEARELVREKLAPYYTPTILSISLVAVRTFRVHVVGMVEAPGAYEANAVTRVSQAIAQAGTLDVQASLRNIRVRRGDSVVNADLTRYLLLGDNSVNPFLYDGDVVQVPHRRGDVSIYGGVYRQGAFEFLEGETAAELLELAGGYRPEAITDSLEVQRFDATDPTKAERFFIGGSQSDLASFELELDDNVFIRSTPDWHEDARVELKGEVVYPGVYVVDGGVEVLSEVIERAGGFTEEASLAEAMLIRGLYAGRRLPPELELAALVQANQSMDWKEKDLFKALMREPKGMASMSIAQLLMQGDEPFDPVLYDGDIVEVPKATNLVRVMGSANRPGLLPIEEGQYANHYIRKAGGYTSRADKRGVRVIRAKTGQKIKTGQAVVSPGDIIWIPEKKERDGWETFRDVIWVVAQIATIFLVIDSAAK
jgi:polysaccharide export outer membrane protein